MKKNKIMEILKLDRRQKEYIKESVQQYIYKVVRETLNSKEFLTDTKKNVFKTINNDVIEKKSNYNIKKANLMKTTEYVLISKYFKLAKSNDDEWVDLSSADIRIELINLFPNLSNKLSVFNIGRTLSYLGAIKKMKQGIYVWRIKKIKTKKENK